MTYKNGLYPVDQLRPIPTSPGEYVHWSILPAFNATARAFYARFGRPLVVTEGYRTLTRQRYLYNLLGYPRANYPGLSMHGFGRACDFASGIQTYGSPEWEWMNMVGRGFGWTPLNERNLRFEPWHWENDGTYNDEGNRDMFITRYGSTQYYLVYGNGLALITWDSVQKLRAVGVPYVALSNADVQSIRDRTV